MKKILNGLVIVLMSTVLFACDKTEEAETSQATAVQEEAAKGAGEAVEWPTENVQICVPYSAGGGVDSAARMVCAELEKVTGKSFVITNKPEGNGIIAINELMEQEPDGYNLMVVSNRDLFGHIVNKIEGVEYDKDSFTYLATLLESADALMANSEKFASFDDMIAYAKENPGKLTIATSNNTGLQTLEIMCEKLGIEVSGVSYSSGNDAFADLLGGHVDGAMVTISFYQQGKDSGIRPVLTFTTDRFPVEDLDVPCVADYDVTEAASPMVRFLMGPAGMDPALVDAILKQMDTIYADGSDLVNRITAQYDNPRYMTREELQSFIDENFQLRLDQASQE